MSWKSTLTKLVFAAVLVCTSPLSASGNGNLNGQGDHQFWLEEWVYVPVCDNLKVVLSGDQRWGNDVKKFWYVDWAVGLRYDATSWFVCDTECNWLKSVGVAFIYFRDDYIKGSNPFGCADTQTVTKWVTVNRPCAWIDFTLGWCDWSLYNRSRVDYTCFENEHYTNFTNFRQCNVLRSPWKWTCLNVNPFLYNEAFFRGTDRVVDGLYENRLRTGVNIDWSALGCGCWTEHFTTDVWWQWRILKQPHDAKKNYFDTYCWGMTFFKDF